MNYDTKQRRRGAGEGYVSQKPNSNGLFVAALRFPSGRRYVYGRTKPEVRQKLKDLIKEREQVIQNGGEGSMDQLKVYLPTWIKALRDGGAKPRTIECYERAVKIWLIPHAGELVLSKITGYDAHRFLDKLKAAGKTPYTQRYAFRVLRSALGYAVHLRAIPSNPFAGIKAPKSKTKPAVWWTPEQANAFIKATQDALYILALDTGMRLGELLALQWPEVSFPNATVEIRYTLVETEGHINGRYAPKAERSVRTIPLTPRALAALRSQREKLMAAGFAASPWVFPGVHGGPQYQSNLTRRFRRAVSEAGLPKITFHSLRHTHASILVRAGVDHAEAAARMGHTVTMFQNTYVHVDMDQARAVAEKFAAVMGALE